MREGLPASVAAELIAGIARGDRAAFERFYDSYSPLAFGLIRRILRDPEAAKEVLQEVFWRIWEEAGTYDPTRGSGEAWLVMRARTRAIDKLRSIRRREQTFVAPADERLTAAPETRRDDPALVAEDRGLAESALGQLPGPQRRAIELAFLEGLTQTEIAARLGEPLGTVKTRIRLGLERLRAAFKVDNA